MTDPFGAAFGALRAEDQPVRPDPDFAARLRARIERALALPRGVAVSQTLTAAETATRAAAGPLGAAVPYLAVEGAQAALDWYADVLGLRLVGEPIVMPDGRIGHSELESGGGSIYLSEAHPEIGVVAPTRGAAAVSLMLPVEDADAVRERAMAAGATSVREPFDGYGQRNAWIVDPFGHRWGLHSPLPAADPAAAGSPSGERPAQGDVVYAWMRVPDAERAAAFYADVLRWQPRRRDGDGISAAWSLGISGGVEPSGLFCCYLVDDLATAVDQVRQAGGRGGEPEQREYGLVADCVDDAGTDFALYQRPGGDDPPAGPGALAYLTIEVPDSGQFRDFYGAVLGWTFSPGRVDDGWEVVGSTPMIGIAGGNDAVRSVPMWQVDDIAAAAQRVRDGGGTATEPAQQPYGQMSECTDDQGTRFYLGQL